MAFSTATPPSLSNWQMSLNGLTLGAGTQYPFTTIDGLGMPDVRNADVARPLTDGEFAGLDLLPGRDITLTLQLVPGAISVQSLRLALAAALAPDGASEFPLWYQEPNLPILSTLVRVRKRPVTIDTAYATSGLTSIALMLHATDPNLYGAPLSGAVTLAGAIGGFGFPLGFPFGFGAGGHSALIVASNAGNRTVYPTFIISNPTSSPMVNPSIQSSNGGVLNFGITLAPGDQMTIDTDTHSVMFLSSGTTVAANRRSALNPGWQWFGLGPGTTDVTFLSSTGSGQAQMNWAPAYVI